MDSGVVLTTHYGCAARVERARSEHSHVPDDLAGENVTGAEISSLEG
jgi:hypothetical protein